MIGQDGSLRGSGLWNWQYLRDKPSVPSDNDGAPLLRKESFRADRSLTTPSSLRTRTPSSYAEEELIFGLDLELQAAMRA
jgi:hypothetical protein